MVSYSADISRTGDERADIQAKQTGGISVGNVLELIQAFGFYTLSSVFIPMKLYIAIIENDK